MSKALSFTLVQKTRAQWHKMLQSLHHISIAISEQDL